MGPPGAQRKEMGAISAVTLLVPHGMLGWAGELDLRQVFKEGRDSLVG